MAHTKQTPIAICVAPNGASKSKSDHPGLPVTAAELADTAVKCCDAGAALIHLHVRDDKGQHSLDPAIYRRAIDAIRNAVGDSLVIQPTSEAAGIYSPDQQIAAIRAVRPEAVSLALPEILPDQSWEKQAAEFFSWLATIECVPQYILYSPDQIKWYIDLLNRGIIPNQPHWLLFVLGRYSNHQNATPMDLVPYLTELNNHPVKVPWAVCAFGPGEFRCTQIAAAFSGHIRVGFENNLYLKNNELAPANQSLVHQATEAVSMLGCSTMDGDALRNMLIGLGDK